MKLISSFTSCLSKNNKKFLSSQVLNSIWLRDINQGNIDKERGKGEEHATKNSKPWSSRKANPIIPTSRAHAFSLFKQILLKAGLPPLSLIYELINKGDIK